mmetsp:Transcript_22180/g.21412  ORF Transcript_22180/g.21412 Transcript_22180/m.21412 type:complete len:221 (+) Transcript_22180:1575-2237(+)
MQLIAETACGNAPDGSACTYCDYADVCYDTCAVTEYNNGGTCTACDPLCESCFGATSYECFSCPGDIAGTALIPEMVYAVTTCNLCGDSYVYFTVGEECDDGNIVSGDGCSDLCILEPWWTCAPSLADAVGPTICAFQCIQGYNTQYATAPDYQDKMRYAGRRGCDDNNLINGDGCNSDCNVETGWECIGGDAATPDTCTEICGDGIRFSATFHECDDGN